jgi:hypothetical protein
MRFGFLLSIILIFDLPLKPQTTARSEPCELDAVPAVAKAFRVVKGQDGVITNVEEKKYILPLSALGDRVSIAALKIYSADSILRLENVRAYLTLVRNAFSSRESVCEKTDQEPTVTVFVLRYLKEKEVSNPAIQKRISYMEGCVQNFTCSSQGEYKFAHTP